MAAVSISVVIPTAGLHRQEMLLRCVRSILDCARARHAVEIIVVLDGGRSEDYLFLQQLGDEVLVITQQQAGPATARNRGVRTATGNVIAFLDDDTVASSEWLADIRRYFEEHPETAAVGGDIAPIRPNNLVSRMMTDLGHFGHRRSKGSWRLITANAAFRRDALATVGGFDENYRYAAGEDYDLCERLLEHGFSIDVTSGALVSHHHPATLRAMLATARRYRTPLPVVAGTWSSAPASGKLDEQFIAQVVSALRRRRLPPSVAETFERSAYVCRELRHVRRVRSWYRAARASPARPTVFVAVAEVFLELLWQAEWVRPAAVEP